jgi:hypothetical protein
MRYLKTFLVVLGVGACGDATAPAPLDGLAFSYAGGLTGTFSAGGEFDSTGTRPWAGAWRVDGAPFIVIAGVSPRSGTTHDVVALILPRTTPGTSTIANVCPPDGCADFFATFGRENAGGGNGFLHGCHIVSGSVTIATITDTRVTGSFTGTGACFSNTDAESSFSVTGGAFDLPLMSSDMDGAGAMSGFRGGRASEK